MTITQEQKNQLIFNATFRKSMTIAEAAELLEWILSEFTELESIASYLQFHGFISGGAATQLTKDKAWLDVTITPEEFENYANPVRRFSRQEIA